MDVVWPDTLQQFVNQDSFTYNFGDSLLRSDNDVGPAKVRRVTTRPVDTIDFIINITFTDYPVFYNFYNVTANGGATPFLMAHPFSQTPVLVRFSKAPVIASIGGVSFSITLEVEVLP